MLKALGFYEHNYLLTIIRESFENGRVFRFPVSFMMNLTLNILFSIAFKSKLLQLQTSNLFSKKKKTVYDEFNFSI